jgi:hypothetical protein
MSNIHVSAYTKEKDAMRCIACTRVFLLVGRRRVEGIAKACRDILYRFTLPLFMVFNHAPWDAEGRFFHVI